MPGKMSPHLAGTGVRWDTRCLLSGCMCWFCGTCHASWSLLSILPHWSHGWSGSPVQYRQKSLSPAAVFWHPSTPVTAATAAQPPSWVPYCSHVPHAQSAPSVSFHIICCSSLVHRSIPSASWLRCETVPPAPNPGIATTGGPALSPSVPQGSPSAALPGLCSAARP